MGGISFSGITQLFTAGTQPPHLAAIAPMSVTDDLYTATGYPGGIFNSGFAKTWVRGAHGRRQAGARRRPALRQGARRRQGDKHCIANQKLRLQTQNALKLQQQNPFRTPSLFAQRAPGRVAQARSVPTFLVGQFQDEQTGGHFAESLKYLNGQPERLDLAPERRARRLARAEHDHALGRVPEALRGERDPGRPAVGASTSAARSTSTSPTPARRRWSSRASRA